MKYQRLLTALGAIVSVLIIGGLVTILITAVLSYKNTNNEENSVEFNVSSLVSAYGLVMASVMMSPTPMYLTSMGVIAVYKMQSKETVLPVFVTKLVKV